MRSIASLTDFWKTRSLGLQIAAVTMSVVVAWWSAIEWSSRELAGTVYQAAAETQALRSAELIVASLDADLLRAERPTGPTERRDAVRRIRREIQALAPMVRGYERPAAARDLLAAAFARWVATPHASLEADVRSEQRNFVAAIHADADVAADAETAAIVSARQGARRLRIALLMLVALIVVAAHRTVTRTLQAVVRGVTGLAVGLHESPELVDALHGFREGSELANALETLGRALAEREQIARSEILQLREIEQMKTDFVSTVSHELRTPLTSIRGSLGLVLATSNGEIGPKAMRLLNIASQNTDRLIRLINDILDIEKIEGGHVALRKEPSDVRAILRTTLTGVEGYATEAGIALVLEPGDPVIATVDPDRLVQVFTNLVSNAIKFSPAGSAVRVALQTEADAVSITVRDQGPGIPAEFRHKIFGKFQQADLSDAKTKSGTGLGLAIARAIVAMHEGDIQFESDVGRGTTFTVTLPWSPPISRRTPMGGIVLVRSTPESPARPTILIAEKDASVRELLVSLCAPLGEVVCAATGEEALLISGTVELSAVIIDPEIDAGGPAFASRLKRRLDGGAVPVLVFSGREYAATELEGLVLSRSHTFVKSRHSERELVMRLQAVLAARRAS